MSIGTVYNKKAWSFNMGAENKLSFTLKGVVSAAFKTEVLFVEIALKLDGEVKTEAGFKLDQHDDGLDLVGYHDGITGNLELIADFGRRTGKNSKINNGFSRKKKWILAAPLNESESSVRINLYGKGRVIPERHF